MKTTKSHAVTPTHWNEAAAGGMAYVPLINPALQDNPTLRKNKHRAADEYVTFAASFPANIAWAVFLFSVNNGAGTVAVLQCSTALHVDDNESTHNYVPDSDTLTTFFVPYSADTVAANAHVLSHVMQPHVTTKSTTPHAGADYLIPVSVNGNTPFTRVSPVLRAVLHPFMSTCSEVILADARTPQRSRGYKAARRVVPFAISPANCGAPRIDVMETVHMVTGVGHIDDVSLPVFHTPPFAPSEVTYHV